MIMEDRLPVLGIVMVVSQGRRRSTDVQLVHPSLCTVSIMVVMGVVTLTVVVMVVLAHLHAPRKWTSSPATSPQFRPMLALRMFVLVSSFVLYSTIRVFSS